MGDSSAIENYNNSPISSMNIESIILFLSISIITMIGLVESVDWIAGC
jgi:hypothetical protein